LGSYANNAAKVNKHSTILMLKRTLCALGLEEEGKTYLVEEGQVRKLRSKGKEAKVASESRCHDR